MIEGSKSQCGAGIGSRVEEDLLKLGRAMNNLYWKIHYDIGSARADEIGFQGLGILEEGPRWSVFGLHRRAGYSVLRLHFERYLPTTFEDIDAYLDMLRCALRLRIYVEASNKRISEFSKEDKTFDKNNASLNPNTPSRKNPRSRPPRRNDESL